LYHSSYKVPVLVHIVQKYCTYTYTDTPTQPLITPVPPIEFQATVAELIE